MFKISDWLDRPAFIAFCCLVLLLLSSNTIVLVWMLNDGQAAEVRDGEEAVEDPAYFKSVLETFIRHRYKDRSEYINEIKVEWSVDGNNCDFRGRIVINSRPINFFGLMVKYNTGWKLIRLDEN
jgi:hypothetical protein